MKLARAIPLVVLLAGCIDLSSRPAQVIVVSGLVSDTISGAGVPGANVQLLFGLCQVSCEFLGTPGTGHSDSTGHYQVSITGPVTPSDCGGWGYYVSVNVTGYIAGNKSFDCGPTNQTLNFPLHPLHVYTFSGTVTFASSGAPVNSAPIRVGLYAPGTSCLTIANCQTTTIANVLTGADGKYTLTFSAAFAPVDCAGRDFLITVNSGPGFTGTELHVPCGQLTATVDFSLAPS